MVLLGGTSGRTVASLDKLAGGALLLATPMLGLGLASSLFDTRGELARLSGDLVAGIGDRVRGLGRFDRTERIQAAHAVLVLAAFFESLARRDDRWQLKALDQLRLAGAGEAGSAAAARLAGNLLQIPVPLPTPQAPYEATLAALLRFYAELAGTVFVFLSGLAPWDELTETGRAQLRDFLTDQAPAQALARYQSSLLDLERECPEVALWTNRIDHQATREEVRRLGTGMAGLERAISAVAFGRPPEGVAAVLARAHRGDLTRPILSSGDVPASLRIPDLQTGYVSPDFRVTADASADNLVSEDCWAEQQLRTDLAGFLAGHLTSPRACQAPLLVLGQPGSGKSVLTRILAARLPASEYLVVRVVLRDVPADLDLQGQIEVSVRAATGESPSWPELARSGGGALCVVLLDGFDELLQATGISQSDYLEKVAAFQQREQELGRPVAVLVTSRTAVADRARCPLGTSAIRLEPFQAAQVTDWLEVWNRLNGPALAARGLKPLPAEAVLAYPELASQPLLLVMLALYDVDGNALQHQHETLRRAELYDRLLAGFARREIAKSGAALSEQQILDEIERELLRLSVVAFAMFNRGQQWVGQDELDADLAALLPATRTPATGLQARLSAAEIVLGRFFFVHESSATRDGRSLRTFEFLHATFAEYLIGRLIATEITQLARTAGRGTGGGRPRRIDDAFLHALLSYAPLAQRAAAISFLHELVSELPRQTRAAVQQVALELFRPSLDARADTTFAAYAPTRPTVPARHAMYSANLVLLAVFVGPVGGRELFPDDPMLLYAWRNLALLWRSMLGHASWNGMLETVAVERFWDGRERGVRLRYTGGTAPGPGCVDPYWTYDFPPGDARPQPWAHHSDGDVLLHARFIGDRRVDVLAHAVEPLLEFTGLLTTFSPVDGGGAVSAANALIRLWVVSNRSPGCTQEDLLAAYGDCLRFVFKREVIDFVTHQLAIDGPRLPRTWRAETEQTLQQAERIHQTMTSDES